MNDAQVRRPYVAGQFYPQDRHELDQMLARLIATADSGHSSPNQPPWAVILPHAGYVYSAATAIKTLLPLRNRRYRRIVVIAPSHRYPFHGLAASDFTAYDTPLGQIPVDVEAVRQLQNSGSSLIRTGNDIQQYEHALEVELPLLQKIIASEFALIPLICGGISLDQATELATLLQPWHGPETLWVVSSDFTHYGRDFQYVPFRDNIPDNLDRLDHAAADLIIRRDPAGWDRFIRDTGATICGANPIKILLALAAKVEPQGRVELVDYQTSGALTGDYAHCVSYAGLCFYRD